MPKELKNKTIIFVAVIILLSIILTLISKSAMISFQIFTSILLFSFFYIKYYPTGNIKKEIMINKLAITTGVFYIVALVLVSVLELFILSTI